MRYAIFLLLPLAMGCEEGVRSKAPPRPAADDAAWAFAPASMRFHPFTALLRNGQGASYTLDVRIELLDFTGDPTKGLGSLRVELYTRPASAAKTTTGQRLEMWEATLLTPEEHQARYDPITRAYRFRLQLNNPPSRQGDLYLLATFTDPRGTRIAAEMDIAEKPGKEE